MNIMSNIDLEDIQSNGYFQVGLDYADQMMHQKTGTQHVENEASNFYDTVTNMDP